MSDIELKKYPIGLFKRPDSFSDEVLNKWINALEELPAKLRQLVENLSDNELKAQYRKDSWSIRQIVHHLPDSHMQGYVRVKLALTEDNPTIKPYNENGWSELADVELVDIGISLNLLEAVHIRWVALVKSLNSAELKRTFYHPENKLSVSVAEQIGLYAWHGEHHYAHIKEALTNNLLR